MEIYAAAHPEGPLTPPPRLALGPEWAIKAHS